MEPRINERVLFVSLNMGCSANCDSCPTRNMLGCSKITIEHAIDWDKFKQALSESKAEIVCLIGGENPFLHCDGHRNIFYYLSSRVKDAEKELWALSNYQVTKETTMITYFKRLLIYVPADKVDKNLVNTTYYRSFTNTQTIIETDKFTEEWANKVKLCQFVNPVIYLKDPGDIEHKEKFTKKYGEFTFIDKIFGPEDEVYSLTDNKLYSSGSWYKEGVKSWKQLSEV